MAQREFGDDRREVRCAKGQRRRDAQQTVQLGTVATQRFLRRMRRLIIDLDSPRCRAAWLKLPVRATSR
jgi:hypothetical protein